MLRRAILGLVIAGLAAAAAAGWGWGWQERGKLGQAEFAQKRLALLEADNGRLRKALADEEAAKAAASVSQERSAIERSVEELRALKFLAPVTYKEIPRSELPAILSQKLAQQEGDQDFALAQIALAALGLLPPNIDLKKTYLELLGEQIGAFYDQHTQELYTFEGHPLSQMQNRVILAHELTHALEDQHFHLAKLPLEIHDNDDRELASIALVEGDATLVMNTYLANNMTAAAFRDTLSSAFTTDVRKLAQAPRFLREELLFPYLRGQVFCQDLFADGGWGALADAFAHPPTSTAQILHPEKYLANPREEPVDVEFGNVEILGQQPEMNNVLGEFGARQLFAAWLHDDDRAAEAASGWRGDRYLVYGDAKAHSYIWKTACADAASAKRFSDAASRVLDARYQLKDRDDMIRVTAANEVIVIDAQNPKWAAALEQLAK
jgi:hypothetical protein